MNDTNHSSALTSTGSSRFSKWHISTMQNSAHHSFSHTATAYPTQINKRGVSRTERYFHFDASYLLDTVDALACRQGGRGFHRVAFSCTIHSHNTRHILPNLSVHPCVSRHPTKRCLVEFIASSNRIFAQKSSAPPHQPRTRWPSTHRCPAPDSCRSPIPAPNHMMLPCKCFHLI